MDRTATYQTPRAALVSDAPYRRNGFGLDDQDFVVAFETDEPKDVLDLVTELRGTKSSEYTKRDTPIFTCIRMPIEEILEQLF